MARISLMGMLDPLPETTRPSSRRIAYLDNARFGVILMVVVLHSLTALRDSYDTAYGIYTWLLIFTMPVFVMISGYTARNYVGDARQIRRAITTLLLPYLIIETTLQLLTRHYQDRPEHLMILSPQWLGWFIIALFVWRLSTPIWRALKYPIMTSILISLLVGLIEVPNTLALPKVLGFLPFYVIGLHLSIDHFRMLRRTWVRLVSALLLAGSLAVCLLYSTEWTHQWLLWRHRYDESPLDADPASGIWQRAQLLVIAFVLSVALLSLVPWREMWTSALGSRTVYAYLLHGYIIIVLREEFEYFTWIEQGGLPALFALIVGACVVATVLMTKPVSWLFRPLFEPKHNWMFRDVSATARPEQSEPGTEQRRDDPDDHPGAPDPAGAPR